MKKLVLILAVAVFSLQSCNAGQKNNNGNDNSANDNTASVQTVSQSDNSEAGSVKLTKEVFLNEVWNYEDSPKEWNYKGDKPALIDFYADWCGPCKIASPILEEVAKEYDGKITVYKVDTEVERELASVFGISSIPAFLYIPMDGKPTMTKGIGRSKEGTKKMFIENVENILLTSK